MKVAEMKDDEVILAIRRAMHNAGIGAYESRIERQADGGVTVYLSRSAILHLDISPGDTPDPFGSRKGGGRT